MKRYKRYKCRHYDADPCDDCCYVDSCEEGCDIELCDHPCVFDEPYKTKYIVKSPFSILDLWDITDNVSFYNLLTNFKMDEWECWPVSEKFASFNENDVPPAIWKMRGNLEDKGFIARVDKSVKLKPGMKLICEYYCTTTKDEFVVCRIGNRELSLISTLDWNRWSNNTLKEGITLQQLNRMKMAKFSLLEE